MLASQPKPSATTPPKPPLGGFETYNPASEFKEIANSVAEQVMGARLKAAESQQVLHPTVNAPSIEQQKADDDVRIRLGIQKLNAELAHVVKVREQEEAQKKQQNAAEVAVENRKAAQSAQQMENPGKGSAMARAFQAMGIRRGRKTASFTETSATREGGKASAQ